jgi:PleD family two-component response regulator
MSTHEQHASISTDVGTGRRLAEHLLADGRTGSGRTSREIVVVDPACSEYREFVAAAQRGEFGLHFCVNGRSAVRLAQEFRADAWIVASELPDMSGLDLVSLLSPHVIQAEVDPLRPGARVSLARLGTARHSGIFLVCDSYRMEDEQRALASGVAAFLVRPLSLHTIFRSPGVRSC